MQSPLYLCWHHGTISLKGKIIDELANKWLNGECVISVESQHLRRARDQEEAYHMTIIAKNEANLLHEQNNNDLIPEDLCVDSISIIDLGLGKCTDVNFGEVWYVVICCKKLQEFRINLGLPLKDFHITLGFTTSDIYDVSKNYGTILRWNSIEFILDNIDSLLEITKKSDFLSEELNNDILFVQKITSILTDKISTNQLPCHKTIARNLRIIVTWLLNINREALVDKKMPTSKNTIDNSDESISQSDNILLNISLQILQDIAYLLLQHGYLYGIKIFATIYQSQVEEFYNAVVLPLFPVVIQNIGKDALQKELQTLRHLNLHFLQITKKQQKVFSIHKFTNTLHLYNLPRNFSFVTVSYEYDQQYHQMLLAGSAIPTREEHIVAIYGMGIRTILTIHESPLLISTSASTNTSNSNKNIFEVSSICLHHYHVYDRTPPIIPQLLEICEIIHSSLQQKHGVLVHCQGGVGRTNVVILAFLMWSENISLAAARERVNMERTMLLTDCQEERLKEWWTYINNDSHNNSNNNETNDVINNLSNLSVSENLRNDLTIPHGTTFTAFTTTSTTTTFTTTSTTTTSTSTTTIATSLSSCHSKLSPYHQIAKAINLPPLLLLSGLAASGKSTFAKCLQSAYPNYFLRINRDEMRGKGECDQLLASYFQLSKTNKLSQKKSNSNTHFNKTIIIDCCNLSIQKRTEWIQSAHFPRTWCIFFDIPLEECKQRIQNRIGHPTIPAGQSGVTILNSMSKQLQKPLQNEVNIEKVITIQSVEDSLLLLKKWKIPYDENSLSSNYFSSPLTMTDINNHSSTSDSMEMHITTSTVTTTNSNEDVNNSNGIYNVTNSEYEYQNTACKIIKYPKIPHAINLGAATRDDKICNISEVNTIINTQQNVLIEEKMDGANIGFSIDEQFQIIVQNRSHYISANYHPQFAPLTQWLQQHSSELFEILTPNVHVLYGEWLYATHSVAYNKLPGWFIAYDIYNKVTNTFLSRDKLCNLLNTTTIPIVPLLYTGRIKSIDEILAFLSEQSVHGENRREGVVIRICDENKVISRIKLVRSDFIPGNERWNRTAKLITNSLNKDFSYY